MAKESKVTVGIAVKNNESTIRDTISSVLQQDYPHALMEIIIVDGLSKDRTLQMIREGISKSDIQTKILSDEGGGLGLARQLIVENAEGAYISWVDGDILIPRDYIRSHVDFLKQNPRAGAVQGNEWNYEGESLTAVLEILSNLHYVLERRRNRLATRGATYRLEAIKDVGGFDKKIKGAGEDIDLSVRMHQKGWHLLMCKGEWTHVARETWKGLWDQFWWYGYGMHFVGHKHNRLVIVWQWMPPVSLVVGYARSLTVYRITHRKISFLLPFHYLFRNLAWVLGYVKSHLDKYGHTKYPYKLDEK